MSVEFSNAYQEILLDNFNSVIKQNMMFQTQLKMAEEAQKNNKSDERLNLLNGEYNGLKAEYDSALKKISDLEARASVGQSLHDEKTRVQSALNEELRKSAVSNETIVQQSKKIEEQSKTIEDITIIFKQMCLKMNHEKEFLPYFLLQPRLTNRKVRNFL